MDKAKIMKLESGTDDVYKNGADKNGIDIENCIDINRIDWHKVNGLLPVVVQSDIGQVLMLGYMNQEALTHTLTDNKVTFFSRSKNRLWTKGETSGNFLVVLAMSLDCDNDALLIVARPMGATCHTGANSCFYQMPFDSDWVFMHKLEQLIYQRKSDGTQHSYTARLYAEGTKRIAQKVGEEGVEVALAATTNNKEELVNESADLVYHLMVLLADAGLSWTDVVGVLRQRHSR